jgi:hypothetical protein
MTFVEVRRRGVDQAIPACDRRFHCGNGFLLGILKDAETNRGNLNTVVQCEQGALVPHGIRLRLDAAAS